ncbi:DnaJ [Gregarina niphandrodes]|uniref:DnaJ n=1 Tax=Gregarina niphandrodes TaxID=110365 RepID=A0A023B2R4_GRENI|nr:DnaJ [Gregarina niphandrodes]EZG55160.1 DnaJ [Gregarina niphandrodes]|eukprot:XP_011131748.1 DnaJ [Gregarina niphandrodes]
MQSEAQEEAEKCLRIAEKAWLSNDISKALRFAEKSLRLHNTPEAQSIIVKLKAGVPPVKQQGSAGSSTPVAAGRMRRTMSAADAQAKTYTHAQQDVCNKVIAAKDLYQVLGVSRDANEDQIKKAYRKLAMQLHPDKNGAPKAEEAFKKISKSFQVLSNEQTRAHYDRTGNDDVTSQPPAAAHRHHNAEFMTPEDLFQAFFFGQTPRAQHQYYYRRMPRQPEQPENQRRLQGLLQLLPILCILLFSWLNNMPFGRSSVDVSVTKTAATPSQFYTSEYKVPYFARPDFETTYPPRTAKRREMEAEVEYHNFQSKCRTATSEERTRFQYYRDLHNYRRAEQARKDLLNAERQNELCQIADTIGHKFPAAAKRVERGYSDLTKYG